MTDPVSELLERRLATPWRWRGALAFALALHVAVAILALASPPSRQRALTLPHVQVRIGVAPIPAAARPGAPAPAPAASRPAPKATTKPPETSSSRPPARKTTSRAARPAPTAVPTAAPADAGDGAPGGEGSGNAAAVTSPRGGIGLGGNAAGTDETFPYAYYLNRVLATIEGNWFRPPADAGVRCRVLCRIDRSGGVVQVGIEEPSGQPAFDRAALRAVYASAPFPPLPQGYGGSTLTLHLEFGSQ